MVEFYDRVTLQVMDDTGSLDALHWTKTHNIFEEGANVKIHGNIRQEMKTMLNKILYSHFIQERQ